LEQWDFAYSAKYASAYYGPSAMLWIQHPSLVTRKPIKWTQLTPEKIKEMDLDIAEGADIVMVKTSTGVSRHHVTK